jgi:ketosteroid isomerase-like protein
MRKERMRRRLITILLPAGLAAGLLATRPPVLPTPLAQSEATLRGCTRQDADARALLLLEDSWATALVHRDGATFRRLLADGFVYTEDDRTMGRDAVLRDVVAGPDTVEAAANEDMDVHCFGTTAAVTGWLIVRGRGSGGRFERRYRFTDTWVRERGRWRVVAAHDYLVPAERR